MEEKYENKEKNMLQYQVQTITIPKQRNNVTMLGPREPNRLLLYVYRVQQREQKN